MTLYEKDMTTLLVLLCVQMYNLIAYMYIAICTVALSTCI